MSGGSRRAGGWAPGAGVLVCVCEAREARSRSLVTTRMWVTSAGQKLPQFVRVREVSVRSRELPTVPSDGTVEMKTVPCSGRRGGLIARRMVAEMARKRQMSAAARRALVRSSTAHARSAAFSCCASCEWRSPVGPTEGVARFVIARNPKGTLVPREDRSSVAPRWERAAGMSPRSSRMMMFEMEATACKQDSMISAGALPT